MDTGSDMFDDDENKEKDKEQEPQNEEELQDEEQAAIESVFPNLSDYSSEQIKNIKKKLIKNLAEIVKEPSVNKDKEAFIATLKEVEEGEFINTIGIMAYSELEKIVKTGFVGKYLFEEPLRQDDLYGELNRLFGHLTAIGIEVLGISANTEEVPCITICEEGKIIQLNLDSEEDRFLFNDIQRKAIKKIKPEKE